LKHFFDLQSTHFMVEYIHNKGDSNVDNG